jgi:integrase
MKMQELLENLRKSRPLARHSFEAYQRAVIYFENHIGRHADIADVTSQSVNDWLCREEDVRQSNIYVRNLRRDFLVVWRYAADCELCPYPKSRLIRMPQVDEPEPEAWPLEWIPRLIESAKNLKGAYRCLGVQSAIYAEAYLRTQLDLLCRPGDMRSLHWVAIEPDGLVRWRQSKTRRKTSARLMPDTMRAVEKLRGLHDFLVFPRSKSANELMVRKIFDNAGIVKPEGQSLGHLRHTGASAILEQTGSADRARASLGHAPESRIFERHYRAVDASKIKVSDWYVSQSS